MSASQASGFVNKRGSSPVDPPYPLPTMIEPKHNQIVPASPPGHLVGPGTPQNRPLALSAAPDAIELLKALRRRWKLGLVMGLLIAAVAGIATWSIIPEAKYTARATLHVSTTPRYII